jgi:hypothetical protein
MANVQIAIWLRGKTGENGLIFAALKILFNNFFNKIQAFLFAHGVDELAANLRVRRWFTSKTPWHKRVILKIAECHR